MRLRCLDPYSELCELIERWVIRDIKAAAGALGYPRKSLDFSFIQSPASCIDPTGYSAQDHSVIATAVDRLAHEDESLFATIAMYYKPWTIAGFVERGFPRAPDQTFYNRLVRAHRWLQSEMLDELKTRKINVQPFVVGL